MKIAFLIRSLEIGGAERQLAALAKGLSEKGHSVAVGAFYSGGHFEKDLLASGVRIFHLNKKGRWDVFPFLSRLISFIRDERPDILHGYLPTSNILVVFLGWWFRKFRVVWGVQCSNMDLTKYGWLERLNYAIERYLTKFPDLIIVNSKAGFNYAAAKGFPKDKMKVIPNGIETDKFRPDPALRRAARLEWNISDDEKLVGLTARLDPMKDHGTFIRAAAEIVKNNDRVRFVCVGGGPRAYVDSLLELARDLKVDKRIIWAGEHHDMPSAYNALDIAVSSSYSEGLSNVIGEAMACGLPCVVTDTGDSAAVVGTTGIVVPVQNPAALAVAVSNLLDRLDTERAELSHNARNRILTNFSVENLIERTSDVLKSLI